MTNHERSAAEERLLDAGLAQVLVGHTVRPHADARRRYGYFAAALLAVGAVLGTRWFAGASDQDRSAPAVQEPAPPVNLPRPVVADDETIAAMPADVQNVVCELRRPAELELLRRFASLRRLVIRNDPEPTGGAGPSGPRFWLDPKPEALAPLLALPALAELQWPRAMRVQGKHVAVLATAKALRSLVLPEQTLLDEDLMRALATLPGLDSLRLEFLRVPAPFLASLAKLPLRRLEFIGCAGLDDAAFATLKTMASLEALALTYQHGGSLEVAGVKFPKGPLTATSFATMATMSALRELDLEESAVRDELLQELPVHLQRLNLGSRHVDAAVAAGLRRLGDLRDLSVGAGVGLAAAEHMVEVLGTLRLRRLEYRGILTPELLRAIAAQPDLTTLAIQTFGAVDLSLLEHAPRLHSLEVLATDNHTPTAAELAPLARCKALRHLRLGGTGVDAAAVPAGLGKQVTVEVGQR